MQPLDPRAAPRVTAPPEHVASYTRYDEAQAAVDRLSDGGFPVEALSIVWDGLRRVEQVTGRRTTARAFGEGAVTGAWFGLLFGLLLVLLVDFEGGAGEFWIILWYVIGGAVAVGAFTAFTHWLQRGRRDFGTVGYLDAASYEVWARGDVVARARTDLGVSITRPMDPPPAAASPPPPPTAAPPPPG